jgi:hypothetical protein
VGSARPASSLAGLPQTAGHRERHARPGLVEIEMGMGEAYPLYELELDLTADA